MRFNEPEILSQEADNQNGLSGVKYSYADGSFGFKAHASKNLIVTSPDNTVTTYNSELIRIKEETQDHTFEYHEDGESVKKAIFYNPENKNINAEKIFDVKVESVNTINVKPRKKRVGRYAGLTNRKKKAIVTLKEGSSIELNK